MDLIVWMIATRRLPKQILPKDVVVARIVLPKIAFEQQHEASSGTNHQVETTPATMACMVFYGNADKKQVEFINMHQIDDAN
jgi:hypothetical protein